MLLLVAVISVDTITAIALVAIAAAPGGALSNIITLLARGNLELSVILTVSSTIASTILSPVLMALSVSVLAIEEVKQRLADSPDDVDGIDGVRVTSEDGWWLLRASNTQDVLVARAIEERTFAEIAQQLAKSPATVKGLYVRALKSLKDELKR